MGLLVTVVLILSLFVCYSFLMLKPGRDVVMERKKEEILAVNGKKTHRAIFQSFYLLGLLFIECLLFTLSFLINSMYISFEVGTV